MVTRLINWWETFNQGEPVQVSALWNRQLQVCGSAGSGDPAAPFGLREEAIDLIDVNTGERFTIHAERLVDGFTLFDIRKHS